MSVKAGVWIDHKQAILILIMESSREIKNISSGIENSTRANANKSYTSSDFVADDKLERKFNNQLKTYYDEVLACLAGLTDLLILGPGEAKTEFRKRFDSKKIRGVAVALETADKMTDSQLAAKVIRHFAVVPVKGSTSPRNSTRTASKSVSAKSTTKSGK